MNETFIVVLNFSTILIKTDTEQESSCYLMPYCFFSVSFFRLPMLLQSFVFCLRCSCFVFFFFLFIPLFLAEVGRWHCFQDTLFVKMSFLTLLGRSTTWAKRTRDSHHAEPHCCQPIFIYAYFCFYFSKMFLKCQPIVHVEYKISANILGVKLPLWSR